MLKTEELHSLVTVESSLAEHIEVYKIVALAELRQSIDRHFERLPDMIEGVALAITDQTDKIEARNKSLDTLFESETKLLNAIAQTGGRQETAIIELQKDVLRLQTQVAGLAIALEEIQKQVS